MKMLYEAYGGECECGSDAIPMLLEYVGIIFWKNMLSISWKQVSFFTLTRNL